MLTRDHLFLIVTHLLRSKEVLGVAANILDPGDFYMSGERGFRLIWSIAKDWWAHQKTPIPHPWLITKINERVAMDPLYMTPEEIKGLGPDVAAMYRFPYDALITTEILPLMQEFLDIRRTGPMAEQLVGAAPGVDFEEKLEALRLHHTSTRLAQGHEVNLFGSDDGYSFVDFDRTPTGVSFIDTLLGGGTIAGEVYGLIAPTGGGKTTTAVMLVSEVALSGRVAAYFSYENELVPMISNRFYGYIGGIAKAEMDRVKSADDLTPEQRHKLDAANEKYNLGRYLKLIDMKKNNTGNDGVNSIEAELRKYHDRNEHVDVLVIDQLQQFVDAWLIKMNKDPADRRIYMQSVIEQLVDLARPDRMNCAIFILHQMRTEAKVRRPIAKPRLADASEDRSFDNWVQFCIAYGTLDSKHRFWATTTKGREAPTDAVIVELRGDQYRIDYKPDKFIATAEGFVERMQDDYDIPTVGSLDGNRPAGYDAARKAADQDLLS